MGSAVIGIDLGTANSCVAIVKDGRPVVLGEGNKTTTPSVLAFVKGQEVVGEAARRQAVTEPQNTVSAVKRLMGHAFDSPEVQTAKERVPYPIKPSPLGSVVLEVGGRDLTPVQVSARVLQRVKEVAEAALGAPVDRAVISVPAHFNDVQRKATKLAAEYAGLEVIRLINEPTAAAFAYGYRKGEDFNLAVYDLGGGTFDITVMSARGDDFEVLATDGDSYLGGDDFDQVVTDWLVQEFEAEFGRDLKDDAPAMLRLREAAERAKIELSEVEESQIDLPFLTELPDGSRPHFARPLARSKLMELTQPLVERTLELCRRCMEEAALPTTAIEAVLLVGGQSRAPNVREAVREFFGREARRDINPDEVVAMGAALYAYTLSAEGLKEEAQEAAGEAFEVALKKTTVARQVVDELGAIGSSSLDLPELKERIRSLLAETEADDTPTPVSQVFGDGLRAAAADLRQSSELDLPSETGLPGLRRPGDSDLPEAVENLREQLSDLSGQAEEAIGRLAAEIPEETPSEPGSGEPDLEQLSGQLSEQLSERIEAAQSASEQAQDHLQEADEHAKARKVNLIDVTSLALGIASANDLFTVLIEHNTRVPVEKTRVFTTNQDSQSEVEIGVRQGRAQRASQNQLLGEFILEGIAPAPRMEPKIAVTFRIDEDGILGVSACDQDSGAEQSIRVEDPLGLQQTKPEDHERGEASEAEEPSPDSGRGGGKTSPHWIGS